MFDVVCVFAGVLVGLLLVGDALGLLDDCRLAWDGDCLGLGVSMRLGVE